MLSVTKVYIRLRSLGIPVGVEGPKIIFPGTEVSFIILRKNTLIVCYVNDNNGNTLKIFENDEEVTEYIFNYVWEFL